jgi:hypothetical protein
VETDACDHTLRCRFRNHPEFFVLPIGEADYKRLWSALSDRSEQPTFVRFTSQGYEVLLNALHLTFWQWLFDPAGMCMNHGEVVWNKPPKEELNGASDEVQVYMADGSTFTVGAEPDSEEFGPDMGDQSELAAQMQAFCYDVSVAEFYPDEPSFASFIDQDGERAYFNLRDIAMFKVPLWMINPALFATQCEDEDDEGSQPVSDGEA